MITVTDSLRLSDCVMTRLASTQIRKVAKTQKRKKDLSGISTQQLIRGNSRNSRINFFRISDFGFRISGLLLLMLLASCEVPVFGLDDLETGHGYRSWPLKVPATGKDGFTRLPGSLTGIHFTNTLSDENAVRNVLRMNGSGVAAGDVDGDGWCDLYFCGIEGGNRLYRNLGGWRFEDITDEAGVRCPGQYSTGAVFADVDGNGTLDLLVNANGGGTRLFLNDGKGHFRESMDSGLVRRFGATSMALGDLTGSGFLDLYVANHRTASARSTGLELLEVNGKLTVRSEDRERFEITPEGKLLEYGEPHILYRNDGHGHFTPVSWTNGMFIGEDGKPLTALLRDWGLTVLIRDLNGDGLPDIYVCNDLFTPDRVWLNDGRGRFCASPLFSVRTTSLASMAADFGDLNRDGYDDYLVADMFSRDHRRRLTQNFIMVDPSLNKGGWTERQQVQRNTLEVNRGDGTYAEIAQMAGIEASEWSWSVVFLDVDLDGYEDVLISTGNLFDTEDADTAAKVSRMPAPPKGDAARLMLLAPRLHTPNYAFKNLRNFQFREVGQEWGFDRVGVKQGICCADLDNDGDLDVITNDMNDEAGVYRNEGNKPRVAVRLKGLGGNTHGVGAKIWLYGGAVPMQSQEIMCGGRYLSGDEMMRVFAAGSLTNRMRLEVRWRSGKRSVVEGVRANREYEIDEGGAEGEWVEQKVEPKVMFEDVSGLLGHRHYEGWYDDFERQGTLPRRLSQLGPGVSWVDVDGDGREDLLVGGGRGGELVIYLNRGGGKFQPLRTGGLLGRLGDEQTTVLGDGERGFVVGQASYAVGQSNVVKRYELWAGGLRMREAIGNWGSSVGPMALGPVYGEGAMGLFVGGRVNPGRWPEAASSRLYRKEGGRYVEDKLNGKVLEGVGMVSGAAWVDLDGDGYPELVLACEWGPVRIFHNDHGRLSLTNYLLSSSINHQLSTINQLTGWWTGVAAGDFDGDGRMDLVVGNWGRNSKYERGRGEGRPLRVYYGDWDQDGTMKVIEGYYDPGMAKYVPWLRLNRVARALPSLPAAYTSNASFSEASMDQILGERLKETRVLEANWLETTVFLNRGGRFDAVVLPGEAQYAPVFGVSVGDMDGDGKEDIFLSQNFFGVDEETTRYDAGRGVWLRGDGRGGFEMVPGQVSGVKVYGEGRGTALCDYDGDGRVDLVVAQNGEETRLYHNVGARPGLRVRLKGASGNPSGIGAAIRLRFGEKWGAAREVQAGSGYWSQDSVVQVMGTPETPTAVWVRWPGGREQQVNVPEGAAEVVITAESGTK